MFVVCFTFNFLTEYNLQPPHYFDYDDHYDDYYYNHSLQNWGSTYIHTHKHMLECVSAVGRGPATSQVDIRRDHHEPSGMWTREQCKWLRNDSAGPIAGVTYATNGHLDET